MNNDTISNNNFSATSIASNLWALFSGEHVYVREMLLVIATFLGFFISMKERKVKLNHSLLFLAILGTISYAICEISY